MLLLAGQIKAALFYASRTPLGLRNVSPQCSDITSDGDSCASKLLLELLYKSMWGEDGQRSPRAEFWWVYKPFDLAHFSFCAFCHTALYSIYPIQVALSTKSLVCPYTNKFKYGSVAALVRMLCNKGISGVPCGFEEWWPNAVVAMKFRPKPLSLTQMELYKKKIKWLQPTNKQTNKTLQYFTITKCFSVTHPSVIRIKWS